MHEHIRTLQPTEQQLANSGMSREELLALVNPSLAEAEQPEPEQPAEHPIYVRVCTPRENKGHGRTVKIQVTLDGATWSLPIPQKANRNAGTQLCKLWANTVVDDPDSELAREIGQQASIVWGALCNSE